MWVMRQTAATEYANKSVSLMVRGEKRTVAEWVEISGNSRATIMGRIGRGVPEEEAIFTPKEIGK